MESLSDILWILYIQSDYKDIKTHFVFDEVFKFNMNQQNYLLYFISVQDICNLVYNKLNDN